MRKSVPAKKPFNSAVDKVMPPEVRADIEAIERAPDSFEAVIGYSNIATDKLENIARDFIKVQEGFTKEVAAFGSLSGRITDCLGDIYINSTDKADAEVLTKLHREVSRYVRAVQKKLADARELGSERVKSAGLQKVFLNVGRIDVLSRYEKKYIPAAEKKFKKSRKPEDKLYAENVKKRRDDFIEHLAIMEKVRAQSIMTAQYISMFMPSAENMQSSILEIRKALSRAQKSCLKKIEDKAALEEDLLVFTQGFKKPFAIPKPFKFPTP